MKILFLHYSFTIGGTESASRNLATVFKTMNMECHLMTFVRCEVRMDMEAFAQIISCPDSTDFNSPINNDFICGYVKSNGIDLIINQGPFWFGDSRLMKAKAKMISVLHYMPAYKIEYRKDIIDYIYYHPSPDLRHWLVKNVRKIFKNYFASREFRKLDRACMEKTIANSSAFVVLCDEYVDELKRLYHCGSTHIISIPNPICCDMVEVPDFNKKEKVLLYVGRMSWGKRVDILLRIFKKIESIRKDWKLILLGDGEQRDELERLAKKIGLRNYEFKGFSNPEEYYKRASLHCLTSLSEGLPMNIIEAAKYGTATITFDAGAGVRSLMNSGKNGIAVKMNDQREYFKELINLLDNRGLRVELGMNAFGNIRNMDSKSVSVVWLELINRLQSETT